MNDASPVKKEANKTLAVTLPLKIWLAWGLQGPWGAIRMIVPLSLGHTYTSMTCPSWWWSSGSWGPSLHGRHKNSHRVWHSTLCQLFSILLTNPRSKVKVFLTVPKASVLPGDCVNAKASVILHKSPHHIHIARGMHPLGALGRSTAEILPFSNALHHLLTNFSQILLWPWTSVRKCKVMLAEVDVHPLFNIDRNWNNTLLLVSTKNKVMAWTRSCIMVTLNVVLWPSRLDRTAPSIDMFWETITWYSLVCWILKANKRDADHLSTHKFQLHHTFSCPVHCFLLGAVTSIYSSKLLVQQKVLSLQTSQRPKLTQIFTHCHLNFTKSLFSAKKQHLTKTQVNKPQVLKPATTNIFTRNTCLYTTTVFVVLHLVKILYKMSKCASLLLAAASEVKFVVCSQGQHCFSQQLWWPKQLLLPERRGAMWKPFDEELTHMYPQGCNGDSTAHFSNFTDAGCREQ